jgi:hypothetical protein
MADEQTVEPKVEQDPVNMMVTARLDGVWKMDADVFIPRPDGVIKIKGVEYPIFSFLDLPISDSLKVARLGDDIKNTESYDQRLERSIEQVMLLNAPRNAETGGLMYSGPWLERKDFVGISPRQIITLTVLASSIAGVPLKPAGAEESSSPSSSPSPSPEPAVSTGGDGKSSST